MLDADRQQYVLICTALLGAVRTMRDEIGCWPPSEDDVARRLAQQLDRVDERIQRVLSQVIFAAEQQQDLPPAPTHDPIRKGESRKRSYGSLTDGRKCTRWS